MKSYTVKKKDFILTLSSSIADIFDQSTTEISCSEYDAETLGKLLLELKKIDYENSTENFQVGGSTRSTSLLHPFSVLDSIFLQILRQDWEIKMQLRIQKVI